MEQNQWTNTPNLEWSNTEDEQWNNTLVQFVFYAIATFVCNTKAYYFEAENRSRNFISMMRTRFFQAKNRP